MRKLKGFVKVIRPANCLMMGLAVIAGFLISSGGIKSKSDVYGLALGFVTAFTLTGASMAVNDYFDRDIDAVNEPSRPIPSGLIKPFECLVIAAVMALIGLAAATLTNPLCLLLALLSWIISVTYSRAGKRTGLLGNFMVSTCVSIPFIYGGACIGGLIEPNVAIFATLAFLTNTGREIIKGIADVEGDKRRGIKTLAISYGIKKAAKIALIFFIIAVALSPLPLTLRLVQTLFIPPLIIADAGFITSAIKLARETTRENAKKAKKAILAFMLIGLIAFIIGAIK